MTITVKNRALEPIKIFYQGKETALWDKFEIDADSVGLTFTWKSYHEIPSARLYISLKFRITSALSVGRYAIDEKGLFKATAKSDEIHCLHEWRVAEAEVLRHRPLSKIAKRFGLI